MSELSKFHVEINGGEEQIIVTKTTLYQLAAVAALATLDYVKSEELDVIKIWIPDLVRAGYGPYYYAWNGGRVGTYFPDKKLVIWSDPS